MNHPALPSRARFRALVAVATLVLVGFAGAQVVVTSSLIEVHKVPAGGTVTGTLTVANVTQQPQRVRLSVGDIREGGGSIGEPGSWAHSAASTLNVPEVVQLGARETRSVPYTIRMPPDADGTYIVALIATPDGEVSEQSIGGDEEESIVILRQIVRYAVEVIVDVPGNARSQVSFNDPELTLSKEGTPSFLVGAHNLGERWAERVRYQFDLYDATSGAYLASYPVERGRLFPGAQHRVRVDFGALAPGSYQLLVFADVGSDDVFAARYTLNVRPDANDEPPAGAPGEP